MTREWSTSAIYLVGDNDGREELRPQMHRSFRDGEEKPSEASVKTRRREGVERWLRSRSLEGQSQRGRLHRKELVLVRMLVPILRSLRLDMIRSGAGSLAQKGEGINVAKSGVLSRPAKKKNRPQPVNDTKAKEY